MSIFDRQNFVNDTLKGLLKDGKEVSPHLRQLLTQYVLGEIQIETVYAELRESGL